MKYEQSELVNRHSSPNNPRMSMNGPRLTYLLMGETLSLELSLMIFSEHALHVLVDNSESIYIKRACNANVLINGEFCSLYNWIVAVGTNSTFTKTVQNMWAK